MFILFVTVLRLLLVLFTVIALCYTSLFFIAVIEVQCLSVNTAGCFCVQRFIQNRGLLGYTTMEIASFELKIS